MKDGLINSIRTLHCFEVDFFYPKQKEMEVSIKAWIQSDHRWDVKGSGTRWSAKQLSDNDPSFFF